MDEPRPCLACEAGDAPTEGFTATCKNCGGIFCFGHMHHERNCRGPFYEGPEAKLDITEARKPEVILATVRKE